MSFYLSIEAIEEISIMNTFEIIFSISANNRYTHEKLAVKIE